MNKQQLISLVQDIENELGSLDIKHPDLLHDISQHLIKCKSKLTQHHTDTIEEIDEFLDLLSKCDIDGIIELNEMFELIDQIHDILDQTRGQIITHRSITYNLLLETKGLLESIKTQSE